MLNRPEVPEDYLQEMMPMDVIQQDLDDVALCAEPTLDYDEPPLEIADYLSHYLHEAYSVSPNR